MTAIAEALFGFIQATIENELVEELNFLKNYRDNFMPSELGWCGLLAGGPYNPATTV